MISLVKICGLKRAEDVEAAIRYGADYLGFIVEAPSKRRLSAQEAGRVSAPAAGIVPRVAVTVNADDETLTRIMRHMRPDFIQCHGDESPERVAEIRRRFDVKTLKAVAVSGPADMAGAMAFDGAADLILYDAKPPAGDPVRGGHGLSFDHTLLRDHPHPDFYALAGGLTPASVAAAVRLTGAPLVDVSSGVETAPGVKSAAKIRAFIEAVQGRG